MAGMRYEALSLSVPYGKLNALKEQLGLTGDALAVLAPYRKAFIENSGAFAGYFHEIFMGISDTRKIIEGLEHPQSLKDAWANWFRTVFMLELDENFLAYLWRIGIRHVEVNLDQRYTNLGFSVARQFCRDVIRKEVAPADAAQAAFVIDNILDLCLLTETSAFIEASSRCDIEIIKGIADRIRNPITVIGGNLKRIQKLLDIKDPSYCVVEDIIAQSSKCESMVADIKTYIDMFQKESYPIKISLPDLVKLVLEDIQAKPEAQRVSIETVLDPMTNSVEADPPDIKAALYQVLENALEAAATAPDPRIRISSGPYRAPFKAVKISIFNTGVPPRAEDMERLFSLFYSTKPGGSGFGLPIARLAVRKNLGRITVEALPGEGTRVTIVLPKG